MAIDFSAQSDEWWRASFERYITGGNDFETIKSGGTQAVEMHYKMCLPKDDYPDKRLEITDTEWVITCTHPRGGPFELRANRFSTGWSFRWL